MSLATAETSEIAILRRIVDPEQPFLSAEAARVLLRLDFNTDDRTRMNQLAAKNRAGKLTPTEEQELNSYIRVGQMLGILQSKARRSLRVAGKSKTH
jgi:hypothetical protein